MHAVLEGVAQKASRELSGLDAETTQTRPDGKAHRQSIQQVVEDLVQGYRVTARSLEIRLEKGRIPRDQRRSRLQWLLQIMILSFGYIPGGADVRNDADAAPVRFSPLNGSDLAWTLREELGAMDALLEKCRHKFGMERVAIHPLLGPLRVDQLRRFHTVHSVYCLRQLRPAEQIVQRSVSGSAHSQTLAKELHIPAQRSLT